MTHSMRFRAHCGALVLITASFGAAMPARAQNMGNGGTTFSSLDAPTQPEAFLGKFVELAHADAAANAMLLQALGAPDAAKQSIGAEQTLDMSATPADIVATASAAAKTHETVTALLAQQKSLSDADKANFAGSALALTRAAHDFVALTRNLGATKQVLMTAGAAARPALYAARATPDIAAQLRTEVKAMAEFAKVNGIALAPEVSAEVAAM